MSRVATTELGLAPAAVADNNGGGFDVFSSLRSGAGGEDFSSGIGEGRSADTDEAASGLDLVAVAGGKEKLDTFMDGSTDLKDMPAPVDALSLAGKSEINSSENRMSDERRAAICQGVASAACASCAARDDCPILRMRNFANENLQPAPERESYLRDLLSDDDDGIVVAGYANPDSGADLTNADITETSDDKTDKLIEQVAPPNQGNEIPTSETTEPPDEPADIKEAEQSFLEPAIVTDDVDEIREVQPENVSEASVNTSSEEYFTEPTEENRPSIEIKQQTFDVISGAVDKKNQQPAFESSDILTQTKTRFVLSSPAVSEDTQIANENNTLSKNETANFLSGENKLVDSVVENTYDGNDAAAVSDIKPSSIEHPKENDVVIATSKSSNPEPRQAAEDSFTPIFKRHLAAQFDATEMDKLSSGSIDGSNVKPLQNTQPREAKLGMAAGYDDSIQALDGADNEQPGNLTPDVDDVPLPQERTVAASVPAEYDKNETYQLPSSYSIDQSSKTPQANQELTATQAIDYSFSKAEKAAINKQNVADTERHESAARVHQPQAEAVLSQTQILAESSEDSLAILDDRTNFDDNLAQSKIDDVKVGVFAPNDVVNTTDKTDVLVDAEMIDATLNLPDKNIAIDRNGAQRAVDFPQELGNESAVNAGAIEAQISIVKQLDRDDVPADGSQNEDGVWLEEEVFFVKQNLPAVEPEPASAEVAAAISPAEVVTTREEADELSGFSEIDSALQLDDDESSAREIAMNDSNERETQPVSLPIIEKITTVELDNIMPKEPNLPHDKDKVMSMKVSEKSDLPCKQDEYFLVVEADDLESASNLPKESEVASVDEMAELINHELGEQDEPIATTGGEKKLSHDNGADTADNSGVIVNTRPSLGLWPDDSRFNPEEESTATTQSSADDVSLVSRLVGMFVVAICVVRGGRSRAAESLI